MQSKFVFKIKIKPWFTYDTPRNHVIAIWYIDITHHFRIYYSTGAGKFYIVWEDGGVLRSLVSEEFDDGSAHDDISSEIILIGIIDLTTGTTLGSRLIVFVDGVKQIEDITWTGNIDAFASTFATLSIGHENDAQHADSLIEYIKVWDWNGVALGTIENEIDFDVAVGGLTERFNKTLEEFDSDYQPLSKRGAIGIFQATENLVDDPEDMTVAATWPNVVSTDLLSDFYINGKRFTKLTLTAAWGYVSQSITLTNNKHGMQAIIKRGTALESMFRLNEFGGTNRGNIHIAWDTRVLTLSAGASHLQFHWITPDIIWVSCLSNTCAAGLGTVILYIGEANTLYSYWTAVQVEDNSYPTPYTPTIRKANLLNYKYRMPPIFTIMFWVRPWFPYTIASPLKYFAWYVDATHRLLLYYDTAGDTIRLYWINGGVAQDLGTQQFDDGSGHDNINQWIHFAIELDLTTGTNLGSTLWVNGVYRSATWSGNIDAYSNDFPTLNIGHENNLYYADSLFNDLVIVPYHVGGEAIKDHMLKNRPWYEPKEIANVERTVKVGPGGIRMHNAALTLTDNKRRLIDISPSAGLYAEDAAGIIIHDIPDALILKDMIYGGHIIWKESPNFISTLVGLNYTDIQQDRTAVHAWANVNLTAYIHTGLTNVKGALVTAMLEIYAAGEKTQATTYLQGQARYSVKYNTVPGNYNTFILAYYRSSVPEIQRYKKLSQAVIPVVYNNNIPYVTWDIKMMYGDMLANAFQYYLTGWLYLEGVLV